MTTENTENTETVKNARSTKSALRTGSNLVVDDLCFICWDEGVEASVFKGFETFKKSGYTRALVYTREYGVRGVELENVFKTLEEANAEWTAVKRRQLERLQAIGLN